MAESGSTKLLVKHLPSELSVSDKIDLLKHFGAREVICMERRGKMVSTGIWKNNTELIKRSFYVFYKVCFVVSSLF